MFSLVAYGNGLVEGAKLANPHLTHMSAASQKIPAWLVHVVSNPIEMFKPQTFTVHFWTATFATYVNMQQLCSSCATPLVMQCYTVLQPFSLRNSRELSQSDQGFYLETKAFGQILRTGCSSNLIQNKQCSLIGGLSSDPIWGKC